MKNISISIAFLLLTSCAHLDNRSEYVVYIDKNRLLNINKYLVDKDLDIMRHFVKRKSWKMLFSDDGYFYEIFNEGEQPKIADNNCVTCDYSISLIDGTRCYEVKNKVFIVGGSDEISGLHHAVKRLGKKGKARLIFPSHLAHGIQGDFNKIPSRAILVYNIQITDVKF